MRNRDRNREKCRLGFTLIELLAVLVLVSLLAATALMAVQVPLKAAQREHLIGQIKFLDSQARQNSGARTGSQIELSIDLQKQVLGISGERGLQAVQVGSQSRVWAVRDGRAHRDDTVRVIEFDQYGTSRSYAVLIGDSRSSAKWLVFCGLTGESYIFKASETESVYAICSTKGFNAG